MKNSRRVVITGLGVVSPIGIGKATFWANLIAGKSRGIPNPSLPFTLAGTRLLLTNWKKHKRRSDQLGMAIA